MSQGRRSSYVPRMFSKSAPKATLGAGTTATMTGGVLSGEGLILVGDKTYQGTGPNGIRRVGRQRHDADDQIIAPERLHICRSRQYQINMVFRRL